MKNKILGLIVCMLLLASAVLPVIGISETLNHENVEINTTENHEISSASYLEEQEDGVWINITPAINYVGGTLTRRQLCKMVFDTNSECVILFSGSNYLFLFSSKSIRRYMGV